MTKYPWEAQPDLHTKQSAAPMGMAQPLMDSVPAECETLPGDTVLGECLPNPPAYAMARMIRGQAALIWHESKRADGYLVLRGETPTQLKPVAALEETTHIDTQAKAGKLYFYAVRAYNDHGQSGATPIVSIQMPEQLEPTPRAEKQPEKQPEQSSENSPKEPHGEQAFAGKRLRVNRNQGERIELKRTAEVPEHEPVSAKKSAPPAPKNLCATPQGTRLMALAWQPGADVQDAEYRIYRSAAPWCSYGLIAETKETHYVDTVPEAAKRYYYFVQAALAGQVSEPSPMAEAFTFPALPPPEPPRNLRAVPAGDAVELQWRYGKTAAAYVVFARQEGEEFKVAGYTMEHSFLHEAPADAQMEYRVQSYHDTGVSEPSGICSIRTRRAPQQRQAQPMPQNAPRRFPSFTIPKI